MKLDQYYTKPKVAQKCLELLSRHMPAAAKKHFIEPSAGNGSFLFLLPPRKRSGIDIEPRAPEIIKKDFLKWNPPLKASGRYVVVGNPPFGKRSNLAVDFFNHSAEMADTIAFIVPMQFRKYSVQSQLHPDFRLIKDHKLGQNSFYTPDGKNFHVRCVFQVWTRDDTKHKNLRLLKSPPISHPDFKMYQYNNTRQALKVFKEDWDFAVPRQGYEDYSRRETQAARCELTKQWILFKAKNLTVKKRLMKLDFNRLSHKNTVVYGFGKADVVMEYNRLYARTTV